METLIHILQWVNVLVTAAALIFLTGAIPFVLGQWAGRKRAERCLVERYQEDPMAFELWLAEKNVAMTERRINELSCRLGLP
jgi:hypothetical protein